MLPQEPVSLILFMAEHMVKFVNVSHVFGRDKHHAFVWCSISHISFLQIKLWNLTVGMIMRKTILEMGVHI